LLFQYLKKEFAAKAGKHYKNSSARPIWLFGERLIKTNRNIIIIRTFCLYILLPVSSFNHEVTFPFPTSAMVILYDA
jgi:hypothetical protein